MAHGVGYQVGDNALELAGVTLHTSGIDAPGVDRDPRWRGAPGRVDHDAGELDGVLLGGEALLVRSRQEQELVEERAHRREGVDRLTHCGCHRSRVGAASSHFERSGRTGDRVRNSWAASATN